MTLDHVMRGLGERGHPQQEAKKAKGQVTKMVHYIGKGGLLKGKDKFRVGGVACQSGGPCSP